MHTEMIVGVLTIVLLGFLLIAVIIDLPSGFLPDVCTAAITVLAFLIAMLSHTLVSSVLGSLLCFLFFGLQWFLSRGRAIGSGDIFLASALGFWLGFRGTILMLFFSYAIGALIVLSLLVFRKISRKQHIPFGPFLALGAVLSYFGVGW